jgi:hypothetical protein
MKIQLTESQQSLVNTLLSEINIKKLAVSNSEKELNVFMTGFLLGKGVDGKCGYDLSVQGEVTITFPEPPPVIEE